MRLGVNKAGQAHGWFKYSTQSKTRPRYGLSTPYSYPVPTCSFQHGRPAFGPSCTAFVYPECWHFDNDAKSKIDDGLTEHGGLLHVLPLAVHLNFVHLFDGQLGGNILSKFYSFGFVVGPLLHACGWVCWVYGWSTGFQCQPQSPWD